VSKTWDAAAPDSKSAIFTRTITFTDVDPLNIYLVGVSNDPSGGTALAAPSQSACATTLTKLASSVHPLRPDQLG